MKGKRYVLCGVVCAVLAGGVGEALAQETPQAAYDRAFQGMLRDPGDLDKTFTYAQAAVGVADYEGAIAALERMLMINPDLPRVRLELGALYFRIQSYEIARTYLATALQAPNVPGEVRERVQALLAEIDKRVSPHRFSGSVMAGARYETNANAGPDNAAVRVAGLPATLNNQFTSKEDWSAFAAANLAHVYDPQAPSGITIESTVTAYGNRHRDQKQVDLVVLEATSGPRLNLHPDTIGDLSFRPYVIANYVTLGDNPYYWAGGLGLNFGKVFTPRTAGDLTIESRQRQFHDDASRPFNSDQDGLELTARAQIQHALTGDLGALFGLSVTDQNADAGSEANTEVAATVGLSKRYEVPLSPNGLPWTTTGTMTFARTEYGAPDPTVDPNTTRTDKDWRLNLATTIPLDRDWAMIANVGHSKRTSSIPNFENSNTIVSVGTTWRF